MNDAMTESTRKSTPSGARRPLVEVVTRGEPRRRWSEEDRARILAEAMAPGAIASHVVGPISNFVRGVLWMEWKDPSIWP